MSWVPSPQFGTQLGAMEETAQDVPQSTQLHPTVLERTQLHPNPLKYITVRPEVVIY